MFLHLLKVKYEPKEVSIKIEKCFEKPLTFEDAKVFSQELVRKYTFCFFNCWHETSDRTALGQSSYMYCNSTKFLCSEQGASCSKDHEKVLKHDNTK